MTAVNITLPGVERVVFRKFDGADEFGDPVRVVLSDGIGQAELETTLAQTWRWRAQQISWTDTVTRIVAVPSTSSAVAYDSLEQVDPTSLRPDAPTTTAWQQAIEDLQAEIEDLAVGTIPDGSITLDKLSQAVQDAIEAGGGANVFVSATDPGDVPDGSIWYVVDGSTGEPGGPLAPGVRAAPNTVGYLGAPHSSSRTLNPGDTMPSEIPGVWDGNVLRINAGNDNLTIDNWHLNCGIDCYSANLTVANSVITPVAGDTFYGILARAGNLTVTDCTIMGAGTSFEQGQSISLDDAAGTLTVTRCELGGYQDAVGIMKGTISQCWVHDIALAGTFHSDGIQIFGSASGGTGPTTVEHCYVDITVGGDWSDGVHQNACVYTDLPTGPAAGVTINNNFLTGGAFAIVLSAAPTGVTVTNNDFGEVLGGGLGEVTVNDPATEIVAWSNNHAFNGDLIAEP